MDREAVEQAAAEGWEEEQEASRFSTSSLPRAARRPQTHFKLPWMRYEQGLTPEWLQFVLSAEIYFKRRSPRPFPKQFSVQPG